MATIIVSNENQSGLGSLASAIAIAESTDAPDTIVFAAGVTSIATSATFTLTKAVTINGDRNNDGVADVTISGGDDHQLFRVESTAAVVFDGLVFQDGRDIRDSLVPAAGAILNYGVVTIRDSSFVSNEGDGGPGGNGPTAGSRGTDGGAAAGAIYNANVMHISSSGFSSNTAYAGNAGTGGAGSAPQGTTIGGDGGPGGSGGAGAGDILNAAGASLSLSLVDFGSNDSAAGGAGGRGGAGQSAGYLGGSGGAGGDNGAVGATILSFGSMSTTALTGGSDNYTYNADYNGGPGGDGSIVDGSPGANGAPPMYGTVTLIGTSGADVRTGTGLKDSIYGLQGDDRLSGGAGADTLYGGDGDDTLDGGAGDDFAIGGINDDVFRASGGDDRFLGQEGDDVIDFSAIAKAVTIDLDLGSSQLIFGGAIMFESVEGVMGTAYADTFKGTADANSLAGGGGGDLLDGRAGADTLDGGAGNDTLIGGADADVMKGGLNNDTYYVDNAGDKVVEAADAGVDSVHTSLASYTLTANVERLYFDDTGNHTGKGNASSNLINGNAGLDKFLIDAGGNDTFSGGAGEDTFDARSATTGMKLRLDAQANNAGSVAGDTFASIEKFFGSDTAADAMTTGAARAKFFGYGGNDTLTGGSSVDALSGGAGNDSLVGNGGQDALDGGIGNDTMTGGADRDLFTFVDAAFGKDLITDFQDGIDRLKIYSAVANDIGDFIIRGNGTTQVTLQLADAPANVITLHGADAITITAADFLFY